MPSTVQIRQHLEHGRAVSWDRGMHVVCRLTGGRVEGTSVDGQHEWTFDDIDTFLAFMQRPRYHEAVLCD